MTNSRKKLVLDVRLVRIYLLCTTSSRDVMGISSVIFPVRQNSLLVQRYNVSIVTNVNLSPGCWVAPHSFFSFVRVPTVVETIHRR